MKEKKNEEQQEEDIERSLFWKYIDMIHPPTCYPIQSTPEEKKKRGTNKTRIKTRIEKNRKEQRQRSSKEQKLKKTEEEEETLERPEKKQEG